MSCASRTTAAVRTWACALPATAYDVRVVPADDDGPTRRRRVSGDGLLRLVPWLRAANAAGHHVYARPASPHFVLVDDLDEDGLDALHAAGHRAAAVVLTSKANHQVWLRLDETAHLTPELASAAARVAAARFGGDPGAASAVQLGRMPGFTNRKLIHADRIGRHPFARLLAASGEVDPGGHELLQLAAASLVAPTLAPSLPLPLPLPAAATRAPNLRCGLRLRPCTPEAEWEEARRRVLEGLHGTSLDRSRLDHAVAARLLGRGASPAYVRAVLLAGERAADLGTRAEAYVARTLDAASRPRG